MDVVFFRHGLAHDRADPGCPVDAERALTDEGRRRTKRAAAGLLGLNVRPSRILVSPFVRARQTAELVADCAALPWGRIVVAPALLPDAPPYAVFQLLASFEGDDGCVVCVGHAPQLDRAIALALGTPRVVTRLKKAGAALLVVERPPQPSGELVWLMNARALARIDG